MLATIDMAALFAGHTGAYFSQNPAPRCVRQPVTLGLINDHLRGQLEIGTYPVRPNGTCRWGCIDLDGEDDTEQYGKARSLQAAWSYLGVVSWIERSRTKGYHVWIFASGWVSARTMRYAGLYVNELTEVRSPEVNPKNDAPWTTSNGLVNTVRMPYPGARKSGRMVVLDHDGVELTAEDFAGQAMATRNDPTVLVGIASRWRIHLERSAPPLREQLRTEFPDVLVGTGSSQDAAQILRGERRVVKGERDNQMYTVARYLHARGVPRDQALIEIERVWRDNCDNGGYELREATEKVERIWRR